MSAGLVAGCIDMCVVSIVFNISLQPYNCAEVKLQLRTNGLLGLGC